MLHKAPSYNRGPPPLPKEGLFVSGFAFGFIRYVFVPIDEHHKVKNLPGCPRRPSSFTGFFGLITRRSRGAVAALPDFQKGTVPELIKGQGRRCQHHSHQRGCRLLHHRESSARHRGRFRTSRLQRSHRWTLQQLHLHHQRTHPPPRRRHHLPQQPQPARPPVQQLAAPQRPHRPLFSDNYRRCGLLAHSTST